LFVVRHVGTARLDSLDTLDIVERVDCRVESSRDEPSGIISMCGPIYYVSYCAFTRNAAVAALWITSVIDISALPFL